MRAYVSIKTNAIYTDLRGSSSFRFFYDAICFNRSAETPAFNIPPHTHLRPY